MIGVPLRSSLSVLDGLDALLAIAQMPPGVPVATVGVDNARNAAALALRILADPYEASARRCRSAPTDPTLDALAPASYRHRARL